jgi:hypothetical protein
VPDTLQLSRQLSELEQVLEFLEQMNLRNQTEVPPRVVRILKQFGIAEGDVPSPSGLIVKVLDRQQEMRRSITSIRRTGAS